jgi:hypothetical protein
LDLSMQCGAQFSKVYSSYIYTTVVLIPPVVISKRVTAPNLMY